MTSPRSILTRDHGLVLPVILMLLTIVVVIGGAAVIFTRTGIKTSDNYRSGTQAFYIAEAGLQAAISELDDGDGTNDFATVSLPLTLFDGVSVANGTYTVKLTLDSSSPRTIEVASTGYGINDSRRVVTALLEQVIEPPPKAVVSNNQIAFPVDGNLDLTGTCGGLHSNGDLTIQGNPSAEQAGGFTSSGYMDISGNPCIGSDQCDENPRPDAYVLSEEADKTVYENDYSGQPQMPISAINPAELAPNVAALGAAGNGYILNNDGTVTVGGTCDAYGLCTGGTTVSTPQGWSFQSGAWELDGSTAADGVFYAETNVVVQSSPGSASSPWQASIIARDSIDWQGSPAIKPYPTTDTDLQGIMIMTGNDLDITGNAGLDAQGGAILVHQQLRIAGNITIDGYIFAGDGSPSWTEDPFPISSSGTDLVGSHSMSGNPTIHYNCDQVECHHAACGLPKVTVAAGSWSEIQ